VLITQAEKRMAGEFCAWVFSGMLTPMKALSSI
jgi:hypothetical protein